MDEARFPPTREPDVKSLFQKWKFDANDTGQVEDPMSIQLEGTSKMWPRSLLADDNDDDESGVADEEEKEDEADWVPMENQPFNMRLVNLANFPQTQSAYKTNYRSHSMACVRAKMGSIQNTAKSLDLMRQLLQKSINKEIDVILQKYIKEYFQPAVDNIRLNNGDQSVSAEHLFTVCRQILEESKSMYCDSARSVTPDMPDTKSDWSGVVAENRVVREIREGRKRRLSSGSESSANTSRMKKRGRPQQAHSNRSTPSRSIKSESVKREGSLWDADRLKSDTQFVMGARANKALGLGATRGRLYIKHPDIFKYSGDLDDKQWLHERHLMPPTGGRTYLLIVDDIRDLAQTDEYRNNPGLLLHELVGFPVPEWMLEKMRVQMRAMRTDIGRGQMQPFADLVGGSLASPATTYNSPEREEDYDLPPASSPLNTTGGFDISSTDCTGEGLGLLRSPGNLEEGNLGGELSAGEGEVVEYRDVGEEGGRKSFASASYYTNNTR